MTTALLSFAALSAAACVAVGVWVWVAWRRPDDCPTCGRWCASSAELRVGT